MAEPRPRKLRTTLAAAALLLAVAGLFVALRQAREQMRVLDACEAAERGDWSRVLAGTAGRSGGDETGRAAAECRCRALLAQDREPECTELLLSVVADPAAADWAPSAPLAIHLIQTLRDSGRGAEAAALARRAGRIHPGVPELFYLELVTRGAIEDETALLAELAARIPARGEAAARMRVSLATRQLQRSAAREAIAALGADPPPDSGSARDLWFETLAHALASAGDLAGLQRCIERWGQTGADPRTLRAQLALALSLARLELPPLDEAERLEQALAEPLADAALEERLQVRRILTLVNRGRHAEALRRYDEARARFRLAGLSRDELLRSASQQALLDLGAEARRSALRFETDRALPGARLLVSPPAGSAADADYEVHELVDGRSLELRREAGLAPLRWVLRSADGALLASGTQNLAPGGALGIPLRPTSAAPPERDPVALPTRRPADARRRVFVLLLDCAEWSLVQYLRARGELPVLDQLIATGYSAVLDSDPPLTAAALESLVWPERRAQESFIGWMHRYGVELAGLASIGDNPLAALAWLLPEAPDLFEVIGAGPQRAANLLFSHGGIRAGRHAEIRGPQGARERLAMGAVSRDLTRAELDAFPQLALADPDRDAIHLRTIAAEFDLAERLIDAGEIDLTLLRIEALDLITHANFADAVASGQDDGKGLLFEVYRYLDARIGALQGRLDRDDLLIVLSDHGIRTAMEHGRAALFVANGDPAPVGRSSTPHDLRGVPRVLAQLFGIATAWPDSALAPWAGTTLDAPPQTPEATRH